MITSLVLSALLLGAAASAPEPDSPVLRLVQEAEPAPAPPPVRRSRPARRRTARRAPAPPVAEAPLLPSPNPVPAPAPQADIAPMPDRSLEAPRAPIPRETTTLRPDLIQPQRLPDARTQSGINSLTDREDRLYRDPAAGARLNIPFSY